MEPRLWSPWTRLVEDANLNFLGLVELSGRRRCRWLRAVVLEQIPAGAIQILEYGHRAIRLLAGWTHKAYAHSDHTVGARWGDHDPALVLLRLVGVFDQPEA